jgi:hypothetical protein
MSPEIYIDGVQFVVSLRSPDLVVARYNQADWSKKLRNVLRIGEFK